MIDKEYFRKQLKNPTGIFTDVVIRTYYLITQKCKARNQDWCFSKEVPYYELKKFTYADPDRNASLIVVKNAEKALARLGYIKFVKNGADWTIHIIKPLDFLDEDIEQYINRRKIK